ncbi:MAG: flagellar hook-basal body complex protein [candidate division Zixibacteria bacterium]|nr:flagellar hook-basal body complex protein [candidate division Zixibacteria bacterium]
MIKGIYDSASGLMPGLTKQKVISNNMANSNTVGFKRDGVFLKNMSEAEAKTIPKDYDWHKPMLSEPIVDYGQGRFEKTDKPLDIALEGRGFFTLLTENGIQFTRNGQFHLNEVGTLVNSNGDTVMSESGPVVLPNERPVIDVDGNIEVDGEVIAKLNIADFQNLDELNKTNGVNFIAPDGLEQIKSVKIAIRQGFLESSNVAILDQMVDMITSFRNFESGQKAIRIQDETVSKAVNTIGRTF